jgi:uroporphyrin-III C-methyltransferase/precorrin-2 dehydrogenase/sirohydrochlorin ferrochelatase
MAELLPLFLNLSGRDVLLVGGGRVAAGKLRQLTDAGARVRVVAPEVVDDIERTGVPIERRPFVADDVDGAWLVVAAATPSVNREVAAAAETRRVFVNAVDDPANASAFLSGVVRREGVTIAVSTSGAAPALTALLRRAIDAVLPRNLAAVWLSEARRQRAIWKRDGVAIGDRTPHLLAVLNELNARQGKELSAQGSIDSQPSALSPVPSALSPTPSALRPSGHVSIVGAGPGDPGLLTRAALGRLRAADLVLFDALIDDRVLRYARKAQRFFVGKRAGRRAMSDDAIQRVMIRAARRGRRVVRLKGGDPFVFGRGGEEVGALVRAGVSYDVVPGVTSAIAAPALAGIPVTYRGIVSAFIVVSGHDEQAFTSSAAAIQPGSATVVVLMGVGRAAALAKILLDQGWPTRTPAAIISSASHPDQDVWWGTLAELAAPPSSGMFSAEGPGTIVIGEVVAVAQSDAAIERIYVNSR